MECSLLILKYKKSYFLPSHALQLYGHFGSTLSDKKVIIGVYRTSILNAFINFLIFLGIIDINDDKFIQAKSIHVEFL